MSCDMPATEKKTLSNVKKGSLVYVKEDDDTWYEARFVRIGTKRDKKNVGNVRIRWPKDKSIVIVPAG